MSTNDIARAEGVAAGRKNQGILTNPYHKTDITLARHWIDGWVEGIKLWRDDQLAEFRRPT